MEERHPDGVKGEGLGGVQPNVGNSLSAPRGGGTRRFGPVPSLTRGAEIHGKPKGHKGGVFNRVERGMREMRSAP